MRGEILPASLPEREKMRTRETAFINAIFRGSLDDFRSALEIYRDPVNQKIHPEMIDTFIGFAIGFSEQHIFEFLIEEFDIDVNV